mmetsp:Transcript_8163/g.19956  ORF Transcript_8163/g.19956 Transcript_8163/m.19956 type:complete len:232 (+) Transcript_8163:232-927(+)
MQGCTTKWKVTMLLTGLPGSPNTTRRGFPSLSGVSMVAHVSGLPGFISTRPKWMTPLRCRRGFTRSLSPIETPPEVTRMSAPREIALSNRSSSASAVSLAMPMSSALAPSASHAAISIARFESLTTPGLRGPWSSGSASSSPVERTATVGWGLTMAVTAPTVARRPTSAGPTTSPRERTPSPASMSEPTSRIIPRGCAALLMRTEPSASLSVSSTMTTASAPSGTGPPVVT